MSDRLKIYERRATTPFNEVRIRSGNRQVTIIQAGWGSSGYYSTEVLESFGPSAWPQGTHMYMNHATYDEEIQRPERDVKDWVGVIETKPRLAGSNLVSEARVFDHWKPVVDAIYQDVGLSVTAPAVMEHGDAGGRHGPIIKEILHDPLNTVDFVTIAGAGGKVGQLIESARGEAGEILEDEEAIEKMLEGADPEKLSVFISQATKLKETKERSGSDPDSKRTKEKEMDQLEEVQRKLSESEGRVRELEKEGEEKDTKLSEAVKERDEEKAGRERAEDALVISGARVIAKEQVSLIDGLPERAQERIIESATRDIPKDDSGKVNKTAVEEKTREAAKKELEYLSGKAIEGDLPIREAGGKTTTTTTTANNGDGEAGVEELEESFKRSGMSDEAAKIAARGR